LGIPNTNLIAFYHKRLALAAKASPYCKNILRISISKLANNGKFIFHCWPGTEPPGPLGARGHGLVMAFYFVLEVEPPKWLLITFFVSALPFVWFKGKVMLLAVGLFVTLASLGFAVAQLRTLSVMAPVLERAIGPTTVEGRIFNLELKAKGISVTLDRPKIAGRSPEATPEKVRIGLSGAQPELKAGDWIRLGARGLFVHRYRP